MKDTVGAGDCFVGTFAYLLADYIDSTSKPIDFSTLCTFVQRSCYASSYSVQFSGGFDKYPTEIIEEWNSSYIHWFVCFDLLNGIKEATSSFTTKVAICK